MRIPKDQLEVYFEYGVDITNRCVFLTGDVDEDNISNVIKGLYLIDHQNKNYDPIELRIGSVGGHLYDMFALHDVTRTLKSPVHTMGMGKVMSSAVLLVTCGEQGSRWAGANTTFMVHQTKYDVPEASPLVHEYELKETQRLDERWYDLMGQYTKKDAKFWRKLCRVENDVFFDAEQAQEWGVIDHIWDEKNGDPEDIDG